MLLPFQCFVDPAGDITVADGIVAQLKTGVRIPVGTGTAFPIPAAVSMPGPYAAASGSLGGTFVGGSGRGLIIVPSAVIPLASPGVMAAAEPGKWRVGNWTLDAAAETLSDETETVFIYDDTGTSPVGQWIHHTGRVLAGFGEFYLDVSLEDPSGGAIPDFTAYVSAGSAQGGTYEAVDAENYVSATDSDWTIEISPDGSAELLFEATAIAIRAAGASPYNPAGSYEATAAGMAAYNLTELQPESGEEFSVFISCDSRLPRDGYVYVKATETAGVLSDVSGPHFATTLPADSSTVFHIPIAHSDGSAIEQYHTGMLIWPDIGGPAGADGIDGEDGAPGVPDKASRNFFILGL
jgi:hypothetical protein